MNDAIQDLINGGAGHIALLDAFMKFSASDLVYLLFPLLGILWLWPGEARERALGQRVAVVTVVAVGVALIAGMAVAQLHYTARPFVSDASTKLLISHKADDGFPSDHALVSFAVAAH